MIKLGLINPGFKYSVVKPQTALPTGGLQSLLETAAWCSCGALEKSHLRSRELDPSSFLVMPPYDHTASQAWFKTFREGYMRAVSSINQTRARLLHDLTIHIPDLTSVQTNGKLLLYEPLETVECGAAEASSHNFFDGKDAPPWDTWFLYWEGSIFSWVPESRIEDAQAGIDANPVDCIHWSSWSKWS